MWAAVILAAGSGQRMGKIKKQFLLLGGLPLFLHSINVFSSIREVTELIIVVKEDDIPFVKESLEKHYRGKELANLQIIVGGKERQDSVIKGVNAIKNSKYLLIHDAARPFVKKEDVERLMRTALENEAAILAVPVKDTIKIIDSNLEIISTPKRSDLWAAQTPQAFLLEKFKVAIELAKSQKFIGTDDAELFALTGKRVIVVSGSYDNIKITTPEDIHLAESIINNRRRI